MANVLSLAMKINADASGFKLDPVEKALRALADETDKVASIFDKFAGTSDAATQAQERTRSSLEALTAARKAGTINAQEYEEQFRAIEKSAQSEAAALQRAAQITEQNISPAQRYSQTLKELDDQLKAGRISQETYDAAAGKARQSLEASTGVVDKQALKFNELSGIFAALPGPLGNVAGRISGLVSAGEGLERIFAGGLSSGISGLASSITSLINPFTLAVGAIAGFGAAASAVVSGLVQLEDRVEKLGNTADKLGTSFEFVQVLDEAARRSGTSIEAVSAAFGRLQSSVTGVDEESKKAAAALAEIGVSAEQLQSLSPEEQYKLIGESLSAIEDPAKRTAAATALFGKSGSDLLPFFNNLGPAANDMERFGATLSDVDRRRIDDLGSSFDSLFVSLRGLGKDLLLPFTDLLKDIVDALAKAIKAVKDFIKPFLEAIAPALESIGEKFSSFTDGISLDTTIVKDALGGISDIFKKIFDVLSTAVDAATPGVTSAFNSVTETVTRLGKVFSDSFGAIFGALSDFGDTIAKALGYSDGLSLAGDAIGKAFGFVADVFGRVFSAIGSVIEVINRFVTIVVVGIVKAGQAVVQAVSGFLEFTGLGKALETVGNIISSVFGTVASTFSTIASAVGGAVGRLLEMAESLLGIERDTETAATSTENLAASTSDAADSAAALTEAQAKAAEEAKRAADESKRQAEEAKRVADAETKRVNELLELQAPVDKLAQDITATNNEIIRTESKLAEARAAGANEEASRLAQRLANLDQLQSSLQSQQKEAAQGFSEGFDKAFSNVDKGIGTLIDKAAELGDEGAVAASQLTEGIEAAKQSVKDGILNKEAFEAEVERQKKLYEDRVNDLREAAKVTEQLYKKEGELLKKQFEIEKERAMELADIRTGAIKIQDIREGGASAFFDALKEDPAVGEAKKQTKELQKIRDEIAKLQSEKIEILSGTG